MLSELDNLLRHLEKTLDPRKEAEIEELHRNALSWERVPRLPLIMHYPFPADAAFHPFPHGQIFGDIEKMLFNELVHAFGTSILLREQVGDDLPCTIRPNFGTVLVASLFGAQVEQVDNHWPWVRHFDQLEQFRDILAQNPADIQKGWCPRVTECYEKYHAILSGYPTLRQIVKIVLPDLQGPLDTADLLRGSAIYTDFYEHPDMLVGILDRLADAQIALANNFRQRTMDGPAGYTHQHATMIRGQILIRNDSAVMISPQMYREQIAAHDARILQSLNGGGIHSCGKIEHNAESILSLPGIKTLDLGQPEMNDIDKIYRLASKEKIALVRISVARDDLISGRVMERFPTGVSLSYSASSLTAARQIMNDYRRATDS